MWFLRTRCRERRMSGIYYIYIKSPPSAVRGLDQVTPLRRLWIVPTLTLRDRLREDMIVVQQYNRNESSPSYSLFSTCANHYNELRLDCQVHQQRRLTGLSTKCCRWRYIHVYCQANVVSSIEHCPRLFSYELSTVVATDQAKHWWMFWMVFTSRSIPRDEFF